MKNSNKLLLSLAAAAKGGGLPDPILLQDFDTTSGFTTINNPIIATETTRKIQGVASLSIKGDGLSTSSVVTKAAPLPSYDPATLGSIAMWFDAGDKSYEQDCSGVDIRMGRGSTFYNVGGITNKSITANRQGGFWHVFHVDETPTFKAIGPGALLVRAATTQTRTRAPKVYADCCIARAQGIPTVIPTFDDGYISQHTVAFAEMNSRGLLATHYAVPDTLDSPTVNQVGVPEITQWYNAGWDIACDGTRDDQPMTGAADMTALLANIQYVRQWVTDHGFTRSPDHFCYPNGTTELAGTQISIAALTANGTTTVTASSTTGVTNGMKAFGGLIPDDTTVVDASTPGTLILDKVVPAGTYSTTFTDVSGKFHTGKIQDALDGAGWKTGRTTAAGFEYSRFGMGKYNRLKLAGTTTSSLVANDVIALCDTAILRGTAVVLYFHQLTGTGGLNFDPAEFVTLCNYWKAKKDAGLLPGGTSTISNWYNRDLLNPTPLPF